MCEQETIFNLMKKNCTPEEDKSLNFAFKEAAIKDYKKLASTVTAIHSDVAEIKKAIQEQSSWVSGVKWLVNSKLGAMIVLMVLAKFVGVEIYQAVAHPVDVTNILRSEENK